MVEVRLVSWVLRKVLCSCVVVSSSSAVRFIGVKCCTRIYRSRVWSGVSEIWKNAWWFGLGYMLIVIVLLVVWVIHLLLVFRKWIVIELSSGNGNFSS